jgi:hypothetical protein
MHMAIIVKDRGNVFPLPTFKDKRYVLKIY